jgi:hypothetical protein
MPEQNKILTHFVFPAWIGALIFQIKTNMLSSSFDYILLDIEMRREQKLA